MGTRKNRLRHAEEERPVFDRHFDNVCDVGGVDCFVLSLVLEFDHRDGGEGKFLREYARSKAILY